MTIISQWGKNDQPKQRLHNCRPHFNPEYLLCTAVPSDDGCTTRETRANLSHKQREAGFHSDFQTPAEGCSDAVRLFKHTCGSLTFSWKSTLIVRLLKWCSLILALLFAGAGVRWRLPLLWRLGRIKSKIKVLLMLQLHWNRRMTALRTCDPLNNSWGPGRWWKIPGFVGGAPFSSASHVQLHIQPSPQGCLVQDPERTSFYFTSLRSEAKTTVNVKWYIIYNLIYKNLTRIDRYAVS